MLWVWASSYLSLLVLPPFYLCLPLSQLSSSHLVLHCLSLIHLPFLPRPPWPTLYLLLLSLPYLSSLNLSPYRLRPLLKSTYNLLAALALPHLPLSHRPDCLWELPPGLQQQLQLWPWYCLEASGLHRPL